MLDILGRYKLAFVKVFLGTFVFLMSPSAKTSVDASFLTHLHQAIPSIINDEEVGVIDPLLNRDAQQVWKEISSKGYSQRSHGSDKELRSIFGQLQTSIEQLMLQHIAKNSKHTAVWIIHTPLIATPLVTKGDPNQGLIAQDILNAKNQIRVRNALARATVIREFLDKGGYLIVVFQENLKSKRSEEQLAIYDKLKKQYPKQLIEMPIDTSAYADKQFPQDKIGATYLTQMPNGDIFEMTNQGVQINQSQNEANWGVWLQMRNQARAAVSARLCTQFQFLLTNGLEAVIEKHAKAQGIAPEKVLSLLKCYQPHSMPADNKCCSQT